MRPYRFELGNLPCTCLSDGQNDYTLGQMFANAPEEEVRALLRGREQPEDVITTPYTNLHVEAEGRSILVDTGAGDLAPTTGTLPQSMADAGLDPDAVDTVILTHAHPDHVGGLLRDDGSPAFPNAEHVIARVEWDYWFSDAQRENANPALRPFFDLARRQLQPVRQRTRLIDFEDGAADVAPATRVCFAPGHTPGHMIVEFSSLGQTLLYVADVVLLPIHLERPSWLPVFDIDPDAAARSKRSVFDRAADEGVWVMGQHFAPYPGLGHVLRRGVGWEWRPVEASEAP